MSVGVFIALVTSEISLLSFESGILNVLRIFGPCYADELSVS